MGTDGNAEYAFGGIRRHREARGCGMDGNGGMSGNGTMDGNGRMDGNGGMSGNGRDGNGGMAETVE